MYAVFAGLTSPFLSIIAVRRGAVAWEIGWLAAAPYVGLLFASWYGRAAEGRPKVPIVVWTNALARPLIALAGWTSNIGLYLGAITAFNFLAAAGAPAYTAVEQAIYHQQWRGRLMGGVRFMLGLGQFAATLVAGQALHRYGAGPVFSVAAGFGVLSALGFLLIREPAASIARGPVPPDRHPTGMQILRNNRPFVRLLLAVTLAGGGNLLVQPGYPIYQVHVLHLGDVDIAYLSALWALAWMLSYPLWGLLCDRKRPAHAVLGAFTAYIVPPLVYALHPGLGGVLVAAFAQGVGDAGIDAGWQNHVMRLTQQHLSSYAGTYLSWMGIRGTAAPMLGALMIGVLGLHTVFVVSLLPIIAGAVLAWNLPEMPLAQRTGSGHLHQAPAS